MQPFAKEVSKISLLSCLHCRLSKTTEVKRVGGPYIKNSSEFVDKCTYCTARPKTTLAILKTQQILFAKGC